MDPKGAILSVHTTTTIVNVGEGEDTCEVVEGEGDVVAPVKGIRYHCIGQKIMVPRIVLLHHCHRPRA